MENTAAGGKGPSVSEAGGVCCLRPSSLGTNISPPPPPFSQAQSGNAEGIAYSLFALFAFLFKQYVALVVILAVVMWRKPWVSVGVMHPRQHPLRAPLEQRIQLLTPAAHSRRAPVDRIASAFSG